MMRLIGEHVNVINLRLFYHEDQEGHEGVIKESCGRTTLHALHVLHGKRYLPLTL